MKMRVNDDCNVFRLAVRFFEKSLRESFFAENPIHFGLFFRPFFADSGFDENFFGRRFDEQTIYIEYCDSIRPADISFPTERAAQRRTSRRRRDEIPCRELFLRDNLQTA